VDGTRRERRACEVIACEQARGVLRVGQWEVEEYTLDDDKDADCEDEDANRWHDPMD